MLTRSALVVALLALFMPSVLSICDGGMCSDKIFKLWYPKTRSASITSGILLGFQDEWVVAEPMGTLVFRDKMSRVKRSQMAYELLEIQTDEGSQLISHTGVITKHLAREYGKYVPSNEEDRWLAESIFDYIVRLDYQHSLIYFLADADQRKNDREHFMGVTLPQLWEKLEKKLEQNEEGSKFLFGKGVSIVELQLYSLYARVSGTELAESLFALNDAFPLVKEVIGLISTNPSVSAIREQFTA